MFLKSLSQIGSFLALIGGGVYFLIGLVVGVPDLVWIGLVIFLVALALDCITRHYYS